MSDGLRIGLCGYGSAAEYFHLPILRTLSGVNLDTAFDPSPSRRNKAQMDGFRAAFPIEELSSRIKDRAIHAVIVCSPNVFHFSQAFEVLNAGAHVLVEKPAVSSPGDYRCLLRLSAEAGLRFVPFHNRCYDNEHVVVRELVRSSAIGRIYYGNATIADREGFHKWAVPEFDPLWRLKPEYIGEPLDDWGPHLIARMLQIFNKGIGQSGMRISAARATQGFCSMTIESRDSVADILISTLGSQRSPRLHLMGSMGEIIVEGDDEEGSIICRGKSTIDTTYRNTPALALPLYEMLLGRSAGELEKLHRESEQVYRLINDAHRVSREYPDVLLPQQRKKLTLGEVTDPEWDSLCAHSPDVTPFHHGKWWQQSREEMVRIGVFCDGHLIVGGVTHATPSAKAPAITPYQGPVVAENVDDSLARKAVRLLMHRLRELAPESTFSLSPSFPFVDDVAAAGYSCILHMTHFVDFTDPDQNWRSLSSQLRSNIRAASRAGIFLSATSAADCARLSRASFARQGQDPWFDMEDAVARLSDMEEGGLAFSFAAKDSSGKTLAAATITVFDGKGVYVMGGSDSAGKHRGALSFAIWNGAKVLAEKHLLRQLDLEGSVIPSVNRFFRQFRGRAVACFYCKPLNGTIFV